MSNPRNQSEADDIDSELFSLSARLERFAAAVRDPAVDDASRIVFGLRWRVQRHMSDEDLRKIRADAHSNPPVSP